uniref:Uncharacterized protein n=1 Tax=Glossina pallidipes TaxID=7398 RepID=A0A1A9ZVN9_GLOPL
MVFIPNALFNELLKSYPELWGLGKGYISWKERDTVIIIVIMQIETSTIYDDMTRDRQRRRRQHRGGRLDAVNPDEEADIKVHQIIGGQPIPNIQTEECITEDPLENTINREEPELEIFPSCSNSKYLCEHLFIYLYIMRTIPYKRLYIPKVADVKVIPRHKVKVPLRHKVKINLRHPFVPKKLKQKIIESKF